jgi:hypothetical protein
VNEDYNEDDLGANPLPRDRIYESYRRLGVKPEELADPAAKEAYAEYLKQHQSE